MTVNQLGNSISTKQRERIKQYLAAAGATAASAVLATTADAALVEQSLNIAIVDGSVVPIDLDGDSVTDFTFTHTQLGFLPYDNQALYITSNSPGSEVAFFSASGYGWVSESADDDGQIDGSDGLLPTSAVPYGVAYLGFVNNGGTTFSSEFFNLTDGFLGLTIEIGGNTHYGWAHMDVGDVVLGPPDVSQSFNAVLKCIAFEDVPGAPALTVDCDIPEPTTMGLLALGATGLLAMRRCRVA
ncbi:MAG: PEP-CTERM sorting domain-containing protein [Bythopirellula sp.]|nr:PEP-CTERM sorting domain-containing protein [Bythopirellula sp.]